MIPPAPARRTRNPAAQGGNFHGATHHPGPAAPPGPPAAPQKWNQHPLPTATSGFRRTLERRQEVRPSMRHPALEPLASRWDSTKGRAGEIWSSTTGKVQGFGQRLEKGAQRRMDARLGPLRSQPGWASWMAEERHQIDLTYQSRRQQERQSGTGWRDSKKDPSGARARRKRDLRAHRKRWADPDGPTVWPGVGRAIKRGAGRAIKPGVGRAIKRGAGRLRRRGR